MLEIGLKKYGIALGKKYLEINDSQTCFRCFYVKLASVQYLISADSFRTFSN